MTEKILTYIGFALRARKITLGVNSITAERKRVYLLILCDSASENTKKDAASLARKFHAKLVVSKDYLLEEIVHKENCKLVALLDRELSKEILNHLNEHFVLAEADI